MAATSVPLWAAVVISVGSPLLAFGGMLLGQLLTRPTARETETRWQREETMRLMRWAADHSAEPDARRAKLGLTSLRALGRSALLQPVDKALVSSVLRMLAAANYDESPSRGDS